tara:strand:- start:5120 stop:5518 length:399 start_codon:yes stop_codon:yes gene_type:complete
MANRDFKDVQALEREVKCVSGKFTFHATDGTTTLSTADSVGVASVSDASSSLVTITLDDKYSKFLGAHFTYLDAAAADTKKPIVHITAETVATTKTVILQFSSADDGALSANADVGADTVYFMIWLKNSSVT